MTSSPRKPDPKTHSAPALKAFFRLSARWDLSADEQQTLLGLPSRSTLVKWKKDQDAQLSMDTLERVSYLLGIFKALHILLPDEDAADSWLRRPNTAPLFNGKPAIERMLSGRVNDLHLVRQYLDAQRGGWA